MKNHLTSSYAWYIVGMLWVIAMLNYLDRVMLTTMHDSLVASIPMDNKQFGALTSAFLWVYGISSPLGGFLADKFSRKKIILFSLFVWTLVSLGMGYVHTYSELLFLRSIMGIGEAFYIPAALALIVDYHKQSTRSLATGIHMSGLYTGYILGGLGGFIAQYFGWRYGYHFLGIFGVIYIILMAFFLHDFSGTTQKKTHEAEVPSVEPPQNSIRFLSSFGSLIKNPSFLLLVSYFSLLGVAFWVITGWLPLFLEEHFKLSVGVAGISATLYIQIASFAGILIGGTLSDHWIKRSIKGRIYLPVIGFVLATPALFVTATTNIFVLAIVGLSIFGVARGFSDSNLMPILCQVIDDRLRATGYGILNFLSTICGGTMIYIAGFLKDAHVDLSVVFIIASGCLLLASASLYFVKPRTQE
ncbi:MFS transporter [Microbacter margulisiae]|uniref:MFS family permease n=1 Tax=Microbacter margulisiae TaxID=1350067 RepID=A0A7W5H3U3_9PORP|nr:MFS transporter [Microbacter margulisiae]MBB3188702.1 MFS family permease [Microbacter margulisiae]